MQSKKYFCYEVFKNLAVWSRKENISYTPCSYYHGSFEELNHVNLDRAWNSPGRKKIIQLIDQDKPIDGCRSCYHEESNGLKSRRIHSKELYENYFDDDNLNLSGPQSLDYSVGNLCNLKCVICGPSNSTAWIPDFQKLRPDINIDKFKYEKFNQLEITDNDSLKNIINVHFHGGGEPLLSNSHVNLIKRIKEVRGLSDVHLFYNTNGTVKVSDEVLSLWSECKLVELYFSLDDVGERFEYQRTGANWDKVTENLRWYTDNMPVNHMFKVNCAWGYLNLYYLNELEYWINTNFKSNRLGDETILIYQKVQGLYSINFISKQLQLKLIEKYQKYPRILPLIKSIPISDDSHDSFLQNISKLDAIRSTSFVQIFPEWASLISKPNNLNYNKYS